MEGCITVFIDLKAEIWIANGSNAPLSASRPMAYEILPTAYGLDRKANNSIGDTSI